MGVGPLKTRITRKNEKGWRRNSEARKPGDREGEAGLEPRNSTKYTKGGSDRRGAHGRYGKEE